MAKVHFQPKLLVVAVSTLMCGTLAQASDIEVYQQSKAGTTTLTLMIDTSGSMGSDYINEDYPGVCGTVSTENSGTSPNYVRRFCTKSGVKYYDRLSRVQDALFELMNNTADLTNDVVMGLGHYSVSGNGRTARILVPAKPLDSTQRSAIKSAVAALTASGGTPSAQAYAEVAAYMLGTTTDGYPIERAAYAQRRTSSTYYRACQTWNNPNSSNFQTCNKYSTTNLSSPPVSGGVQYSSDSDWIYFKAAATSSYDSGFASSVSSSKSGSVYASPLPSNSANPECNGQGIYFLTDGYPNSSSTTRASAVMAKALNQSSFSCGTGLSGGNSSGAWGCLGSFAQALEKSNNPKGVSIKTAVVGFGAVFDGMQTKSGSYENDKGRKIDRIFYNCNTSGVAQDAKNACNWGEVNKGDAYSGTGGYGQGGFYNGKTTEDVIKSVIQFTADLKTQIPPLPTGSTVIPQDQLNRSTLQPYGYLTMLEPQPGTAALVWPGNLKRYKIANGTVKDKNSTKVFSDRNGTFATGTFDLWNNTSTADGAITQAGGMYAQIPVPTQASPSTSRSVYTNPNSTGTTLVRLTADLANYSSAPLATNFTLPERLLLLNAIGYNLDVTAAALPTSLTPPTTPYKVLGGVVHSTPTLMTYSASSVTKPSEEDTSRQDFVMFGSLDGMLHVVNARTGVEVFAFLPRELVKSQGNGLKLGATGSPAPVYGVDAPWIVDPTYVLNRNSNRFEAKFLNVYGGLRMGGSSYYGFNLKNLSSPQMLFRIGSDQADFSRMGQTWAKPVITTIRYNKKRTKVMIVPGGYDMCYENPEFALNSTDAEDLVGCSGKSKAQGNAVYIIDAQTGQRLWWTSDTGASTNNSSLVHSITGRVNVTDRDADGLSDHIYFADLGGQVFRVDIDNQSQLKASNTSAMVKRVVRLMNVGTNNKHNPRFYEAPAVSVHDEGTERFLMINVASGDRSSPLDVLATNKGGDGISRPNNNRVYGLFDRDVVKDDLYTLPESKLESKDVGLSDLQASPQTNSINKSIMLGSNRAERKEGWYYDLTGSITGALKGYDELIALNGDLYATIYNPDVQTTVTDNCSARVTGETNVRRYCLPYGLANGAECQLPSSGYYEFKIGAGIQGVSIGADDSSAATRRIIFNQEGVTKTGSDGVGSGTADQLRIFETPKTLIPQRWFEKQPNPNKVK
jgi:type IV pilus assembly protein PilY1